MVVAVAMCASLNPWCTRTLLGTPGNNEVSSETLLIFRSVRTDRLERSGEQSVTNNHAYHFSSQLFTRRLTAVSSRFPRAKRPRPSVLASIQQRLGGEPLVRSKRLGMARGATHSKGHQPRCLRSVSAGSQGSQCKHLKPRRAIKINYGCGVLSHGAPTPASPGFDLFWVTVRSPGELSEGSVT